MSDTIIQGDFPFEEIRDDVVGGNGDYFFSWEDARLAGFDDDQIWSIVEGDDGDVWVYGPPHHYVNVIGFIATKERHDNATYYEEALDVDDEEEADDDSE